MARDDTQQWEDDDQQYSSRDSDDSPLLSYRYNRSRRYAPYSREIKPERERRWPVTVIAKFSLFSTAMILFCVLMYIPVYNRANDQMPKVAVAGWSIHTNRDTKIYVQPDNVTTIHEPKDVCPKSSRNKKNNLFLLIVVCSSTIHFDRRTAIRETWGNYKNYLNSSKIFHAAHEKYKNYNYTYDLYNESNNTVDRKKRGISSFGQLLPELAKALKDNIVTDGPVEKRFEDESDEKMLPEFDMNKELGENEEEDYDYESNNNIMKIPPKGYEDNIDLDKVIAMLKNVKDFPKEEILEEESGNTVPDFKVVFLLGLPASDNSSDIQDKIDEEVERYGDVIQEGFIDSYNNLTLKSIMMLKWVTNNCNESVRYILKTDDDMYINVPNLISNLQNRSKIHDESSHKEKEYLLIGDLICGARPVLDTSNKWYSPRYMYGGSVYPRYLSGTGYVFSAPAAHALYRAALRTSYFHLEDIYITGICAARASPRVVPRDEPGFTYSGGGACAVHARLSAHRVPPGAMRRVANLLRAERVVDGCERKRLTQMKNRQGRIYIIYKYLRLFVSKQC
ncbi:uncharacterized protein LOC123704022 [Colias croceus]|uniref:uncharacterized protein LOC123704022 n=1 Tax=Colias crocea TaxID=72248 RepID=UPI001E27B3D5|nr:uncharacterized protein LOC123704022 [Colias croceus]